MKMPHLTALSWFNLKNPIWTAFVRGFDLCFALRMVLDCLRNFEGFRKPLPKCEPTLGLINFWAQSVWSVVYGRASKIGIKTTKDNQTKKRISMTSLPEAMTQPPLNLFHERSFV